MWQIHHQPQLSRFANFLNFMHGFKFEITKYQVYKLYRNFLIRRMTTLQQLRFSLYVYWIICSKSTAWCSAMYGWFAEGRKKEEKKKGVPKIHNSLLFCVPDLTSITYEISCKPTAVLFYTFEHILVGMCLDYDLVGLH